MSKELIINKRTKLDKIINKQNYTKINIRDKIDPNKINEFCGIKELVIGYSPNKKGNNYNERNINLIPFKKRIEKISFQYCSNFGIVVKNGYKPTEYYKLEDFKNLKTIEFPSSIKKVCNNYLKECESLETIIFNVNHDTFFQNEISLPPNLKEIIIKFGMLEFNIDLEYKIESINEIYYNDANGKIIVEYVNENTTSTIMIDPSKYEIVKENEWFNYNEEEVNLFIPDYVTKIYYIERRPFHEISLNLNLLERTSQNFTFIDTEDYYHLDRIILRTNNDMQLIPKKIINVNEYGRINKVYLQQNLLNLEYKTGTITIDSKGNMKRLDDEEKTDNNDNLDIDLEKYSLEELEEYASYLKLLKLVDENDIEYKNAMDVVRNRVIKKLKKH